MPRTTQVLLVLAISFAVYGLIEPLVPRQHVRAILFIHGVIIGCLCYSWVRAEALQRNAETPGRSALWAGLFPLLGLPIYFLRTRPLRRALVGTGKAALLLVALSVGASLLSALSEALQG